MSVLREITFEPAQGGSVEPVIDYFAALDDEAKRKLGTPEIKRRPGHFSGIERDTVASVTFRIRGSDAFVDACIRAMLNYFSKYSDEIIINKSFDD